MRIVSKYQVVVGEEKLCNVCHESKHLSEFTKHSESRTKLAYSCKQCWHKIQAKYYSKISPESRRKPYYNSKAGEDKKEIADDAKSGGCVECGYSKCLEALQFHHTDPAKKNFVISDYRKFSVEKLMAELSKCMVLCANCHIELHRDLKMNNAVRL